MSHDDTLHADDDMTRAAVTDLRTGLPHREDDGKTCRNCVFSVLADDENEPLPFECAECTRSGLGVGTKDNWTDNGEEPDTVTIPGRVQNWTEVDDGTATHARFMVDYVDDEGRDAETEYRIPMDKICSMDLNEDAGTDDFLTIPRIYATEIGLAEAPENRTDPDASPSMPAPTPPDARKLRSETIDVSIPLDMAEREAVGTRMADALQQIADLEDDLDAYRKDINARIKALQKDAEKASREWRAGAVEQEIFCDVLADYDACQIVWIEADTGREVQRRAMTAEERQLPLPLTYPDAPADGADNADTAARPVGETIGAPHATNRHTCIDCAHLTDADAPLSHACETCSHAGNGDADNWDPKAECRTCAHHARAVDAYPCAGCSLNVMPEHRGDDHRWDWMDAPREPVVMPAGGPASDDNAPGEAQRDAHASV